MQYLKKLLMKKIINIIIATAIISSCSTTTKQSNFKTINVSILPQKYFAERLLGDSYHINVVVKAGYNPETYEPTPQQLVKLESASLYLQLCKGGFDQSWINNLKDLNVELDVKDMSDGISVIEEEHKHHDHHHYSIDPHIWISPSTTIKMVENIKEALIAHFPTNVDSINKAYKKLHHELVEMDNQYKKRLAPYSGEKFLIFHPVLSYVARDYGLDQLSMEFEGKEPSVKHLSNLIAQSRQNQIKIIFVQKEFDRTNAELLASETGAKIVTIDPLNYNWFEESESILNHLVESYQTKP